MYASRHSWAVIAVMMMTTWSIGCRGPQSRHNQLADNSIQMTEDTSVDLLSTPAPPQRLSSSQNQAAEAIRRSSTNMSRGNDVSPTQTRLAQSTVAQRRASKEPVAARVATPKSRSVEDPRLSGSEPAKARVATRPPSRSAAVEALLAANKRTNADAERSGGATHDVKPAKKSAPVRTSLSSKDAVDRAVVSNNKKPHSGSGTSRAATGDSSSRTKTTVVSKQASSKSSGPSKARSLNERLALASGSMKDMASIASESVTPSIELGTKAASDSTKKPVAHVASNGQQKVSAKASMGAFRDLPVEVRRRAMKRLVANLAKQADLTDYPKSITNPIKASLASIPKLPPLKNVRPKVTPTRIASAKSSSSSGTDLHEVKITELSNDSSATRLADLKPKQTTEPINSTQVDTATHEFAQSETMTTPEVVDDSGHDDDPIASVVVDPPAPKLSNPSTAKVSDAFVMAPPSPVVTMPMPNKAETPGFEMPSNAPTKPIGNRARQRSGAVRKLSSETPVFEMPTKATQKTIADGKPASLDVVDLERIDLSLQPISAEINRLPHQLVRDQFRVSRVGLPDPKLLRSHATETASIATRNTRTQNIPSHVQGDESVSTASAMESLGGRNDRSSNQIAQKQQPLSELTPSDSHRRPNNNRREVGAKGFVLPVVSATEPEATLSVSSNLKDQRSKLDSNATMTKKLAASTDVSRSDKISGSAEPADMSDQELFEALLSRLTDTDKAETDAERNRRMIMAQHLMVLSGDSQGAKQHIKGLSKQEQAFLRHQLDALSAMVDPNGHPVAGRRFSMALPKLREATRHLSAAAGELEVRELEFCTEIEAYGQVKPFPDRDFVGGQQVILYSEVENFTSKKTASGFLTHLSGTYDIYNESNEKVVTQVLPADQQTSRKVLRDYFVAYQMRLPKKLSPGKYRMELTLEDVEAEKYGQSEISFQIVE